MGTESSYDVLILGGGFAGVACARQLRRFNQRSDKPRVCLVSDENYMVFQPLLAEVAAASISPRHVVNPIRQLCRGIQVLKGSVRSVNLEDQHVSIDAGDFTPDIQVGFRQLVVALGAEVDLSKIPGMAEHGLLMRNVGDAMKLRSTIISRFEEANLIGDLERRRRLLRFVVVGGGYSGVETAGEILDLMQDMHKWYANVNHDDFKVILVHSRDVLLPTLSEDLARYCEARLRDRGVEFILNERVQSVTANRVKLSGDQTIDSNTVICTVGNAPHRIVRNLTEELGLPSEKGRLSTDEFLRIKDQQNIWAAGDCAAVPMKGGGFCPDTAQFAHRQGETLGKNLVASLKEKDPRPFTFTGLGELAAIGHRTAVAEILGMHFSGFIAWWMWRTIYLSKLPGFQRKLRVVIDWTFDLFFSRDINLLNPRYSKPLKEVLLTEGDVLFHAGEPAFSLYFVKSGVVKIHDDGNVIKTVRSGQYFGERALLGDGVWHYTAEATESTCLVALGAPEFHAIIEGSDALRKLFERSAQAYLSNDEIRALEEFIEDDVLEQPVSDLMNDNVDTLRSSMSVREAIRAIQNTPHGSYPVVDDEGKTKGVLKRDDLYDALKRGDDPSRTHLSDLQMQQLPHIRPNTKGHEAVKIFIRSGRNKVLVVDESEGLRGILTIVDLVESRIREEKPSTLDG